MHDGHLSRVAQAFNAALCAAGGISTKYANFITFDLVESLLKCNALYLKGNLNHIHITNHAFYFQTAKLKGYQVLLINLT